MAHQPAFDQILFIGPSPGSLADSPPKVLACFPAVEITGLSFQNLISFSFPTKKEFKTKLESPDFIRDMYIYRIKDEVFEYYGSSILICPEGTKTFLSTASNEKALFCITIVSRKPICVAHLQFLRFLASLTANKIKSPSDFLLEPLLSTPEESTLLPGYYLTEQIGHLKEISLPSQMIHAIHAYNTFTFGDDALVLSKKFRIHLPEPANSQAGYLEMATFDTLFSLFPVDQVILLVSALILDHPVLIIGRVLQEVTATVLALEQLIKPVSKDHVLPIIPNNEKFDDFLEFPGPFLFGLYPCHKATVTEFREDSIIVNLDTKKVEYDPNEIQILPGAKKLESKINKIIKFNAFTRPTPLSFPPQFREKLRQSINLSESAVAGIRSKFYDFMPFLNKEELSAFFVSQQINGVVNTDFNRELFVSVRKEEDRDFYAALLESNTFLYYCQLLMEAEEKERGAIMERLRNRPPRHRNSRRIVQEFFN